VRVTPILSASSRSAGNSVPAGYLFSQILLTIYSSANAAGLCAFKIKDCSMKMRSQIKNKAKNA